MAILAVLAAAAAASAPPAPAAAHASSLQADFNAATEAYEKGDCATALPVFARLAQDPRIKPRSTPGGAVALRQGICQILTGNPEDGEPAIERGLVELRKAGPDLASDVRVGEKTLGDLAVRRWDHDAAIAHYRQALDLATGLDRLGPLGGLSKVTAFDGGATGTGYAEEGLRLLAADPKAGRANLAVFHTLHARALLNQGRSKEAYSELQEVLRLSGGLGRSVSLEQAAMRGDLAQAALLTGQKDDARKYLAYTGAGRITESPFATAALLDLPACGAETGLAPDDVAIVEFGIGEDGTVTGAQTVYARGDYAKASAFARAVSRWYWVPEDLAKLPLFYRLSTRVELRCSTGASELADAGAPLAARFGAWAAPHLPQVDFAETTRRGQVALARRTLAAAEARHDDAGTIAALGLLARVAPPNTGNLLALMDRALALAETTKAPVDATGYLRVARTEARIADALRKSRGSRGEWYRQRSQMFAALAAEPAIAADPLAQDTAILQSIPRLVVPGQSAALETTLRRVADDDRLPAQHPLRQLALLKLASLAASDKRFEAAQGYFVRTGLNEEQCALIGPVPALRSTGNADSKFPVEAMQYGFEGWVKVELDINANGTTGPSRAVVAYPPFVFVDAAGQIARGLRFEPSYRPAGGAACSAYSNIIRFGIPDQH